MKYHALFHIRRQSSGRRACYRQDQTELLDSYDLTNAAENGSDSW